MAETAPESLERAPTGVETTKRPVDVERSKDKPDELQCGPKSATARIGILPQTSNHGEDASFTPSDNPGTSPERPTSDGAVHPETVETRRNTRHMRQVCRNG